MDDNIVCVIIYNNVSYFPECNKIIERYKAQDAYSEDVSDQFYRTYKNITEDIFSKRESSIAFSYLFDVDYNNKIPNISSHVGFLYLYYWIYHELNAKKNVTHTKNVYEALVKDYCQTYKTDGCKGNESNSYSTDEINNLTAIYDLYGQLNIIKDACVSKKDANFCKSVNLIINQYITQVKTNDRDTSELELKPCVRTNIGITIITSILVMLLISLLAFFAFKFTTYGSWMSHKIMKLINKRNKIDEEWNMLQQCETSDITSSDQRYNVLYNCD
ncbi:variable surface protein [Plasmodium gonderi]|uniref:Variable surface protein n=1 Tax=Plasmodium gonderi TaxID=77519 RepID=A0A1Y1JPI4_PLAGO|nr:variable surface protein [Plasmodium gonderi]GAW82742.1 variable surface protein [Plasmodium gonderi]